MAIPVKWKDKKGRIRTFDELIPGGNFNLNIARGKVPGYSVIHKFGHNPSITTATDPEDIWDGGGIWVAPTQARIHQLTSTSAEDGAVGLTGALTMQVQGLDRGFNLQEETLILNGQANVPTKFLHIMIHRMFILTAGSTGWNVGDITATADTDGTVTAQINAQNNQTGMALYQIASGAKGYMTNFYGSLADSQGGGANVDIEMIVKPFGGVNNVKQFHGLVAAGAAHFNHLFPVPMEIEGKAIVKMRVKTTSATAVVSAGYDLILIKDGF